MPYNVSMMNMHKEHSKLLAEIKRNAGRGTKHSWSSVYLGNDRPKYDISNPIRRKIAKVWLRENKNISNKDFVSVVNSLYGGKSGEEISFAGMLLGYNAAGRGAVKLTDLDRWLSDLRGWSEVDSLCQNVFTYKEMLVSWGAWKKFLIKLSKDKNINKRRSSLVFLTSPVNYSNDVRIRDLAFELVAELENEKPILITKAISWLLRSMVEQHKILVSKYINDHRATLPKIAIRETERKIKTGRK